MSNKKGVAVKKTTAAKSNTFSVAHAFHLKTLSLSEVCINKKHPRKITDQQVEAAVKVVTATSLLQPIIVDENFVVLHGQENYEAAKVLGFGEIDVLIVDGLNEAQKKVVEIAYAKIIEKGEWDKSSLAESFQFLIDAEFSGEIDFSIEVTGFLTPEVDLVLMCSGAIEEDITAEIIAADLAKPQVTRPGDVWVLDTHKIICGNSLDEAIYQKLLDENEVALVSTDPPYNVKIDKFVSGNGAVKHKDFAMACDEMSKGEFEDFLFHSLSLSSKNLKDGACIYATMDWRHMQEIQATADRCELSLLNVCVWDKGVGGMGSLYRSQHELVFVFKKGKARHINNIQLGKFGRNRTNVWRYPSANMSKEGRMALKDHPTPKPVAMIADIMRDVTEPHDIVLDPFLGGGTTIIAAEKTSRRGFGIELDPRYVDVCIRRWEKMTGKQARHVESNMSFTERESSLNSSKKTGTEVRRDRER